MSRLFAIGFFTFVLGFTVGCQKENKKVVLTPETAANQASYAGVYIQLRKIWDDRGDGYGANFLFVESVDWRGVGHTDPEILRAIEALRIFDFTINSDEFKERDRWRARIQVRDAIAALQGLRQALIRERDQRRPNN